MQPQGGKPRGRRRRGAEQRDRAACNHGARREHHGALDRVLELAHVARPVVLLQRLHHLVVHLLDVLAGPLRVLFDEVIDQHGDVFAPLAQRQNLNRDDVQPIVEVLLEPRLGDHLLQIAVGRRDHAHLHALRPLGAERLEFALLQHAQQLRLDGGRHRADLVEEDRSAVGERELPALGHHRAGERAAHVAEELRFEQRLGNRRTVDLDERHVALRAAVMDGARHHLLAGSGLAGDQHRALGLRDELRALNHFLHRAAAADDAVLVEFRAAFADQVLTLRSEALMLERMADQRQQLFDLERLLQVIERAQLHRLDGALHRRVRRHHQHLRPLRRRHRLRHLANQLEPRHPGHDVVDHEEIERLLEHLLLRPARGGRLDDLVPFVPKRAPEALEDLFLVVGEQD